MDGTINKLFEGRTQNYMACINVEYKSVRADPFMDLQLDVKGCHTIYDSFNKYCEVERLDGQNQYMAEGHGLQVGLMHAHAHVNFFHVEMANTGQCCRWGGRERAAVAPRHRRCLSAPNAAHAGTSLE